MSARICLSLAAALAFVAVLAGAFGAHGLSDSGYLERSYSDMEPKNISGMELPPGYKYLQDFRTGVRYHMWHALALFGVGLLMQRRPSQLLSAAAWCFVGGIVFFSGSLYLLSLTGISWLGAVTPIGGLAFIAGWLCLTIAAWKN